MTGDENFFKNSVSDYRFAALRPDSLKLKEEYINFFCVYKNLNKFKTLRILV